MASMNDFAEVEDDTFTVQPYMFEPLPGFVGADNVDSSASSESESDGEDTQADEGRRNNSSWCSCECCEVMATEVECKCCHEYPELDEKRQQHQCITQHEGFVGNCLNPDVIEVSFYEFLQQNGPIGDNEPINEVYRYIAYRRLARWIWHRLGKRDRRVLPACAVKRIRQQFPSESYVGFVYAERDL